MTENIEPQFGAATRSPLSNSAVPVTLKKNLLGFGAPCFNFSSSLTPCEAQTCSGCKSVLLYSAPYIRLGYLGPIDASPAHVDWLSQTGLERGLPHTNGAPVCPALFFSNSGPALLQIHSCRWSMAVWYQQTDKNLYMIFDLLVSSYPLDS